MVMVSSMTTKHGWIACSLMSKIIKVLISLVIGEKGLFLVMVQVETCNISFPALLGRLDVFESRFVI